MIVYLNNFLLYNYVGGNLYGNLIIFLLMLFVLSYSSNKAGVKPLSNFESEKYSGKWNGTAGIDNRFEKNLINGECRIFFKF